MADFNGSSVGSGTPTKLSSQEYLEQLRLRRQQRYQNDTNLTPNQTVTEEPSIENTQPEITPPPEPQPITVPTFTPPVIEPTYAQEVQQPVVEESLPPANPVSEPYQSNQTSQSETPEPNQAPTEPYEYDEPSFFPGQMKPIKEEVVLEWLSPSRPFKKRNRQFFSTVAIIALLISLILFFAGQVLIIAVVISVVFLGYVLATVPPDNIKHTITTHGINSDGILYYWDELGRFWFDTKLGQRLVSIETNRFPARIILLLGDQPEELIRDILAEVLLEERPIPSTLEKIANWLEEKIPLETS